MQWQGPIMDCSAACRKRLGSALNHDAPSARSLGLTDKGDSVVRAWAEHKISFMPLPLAAEVPVGNSRPNGINGLAVDLRSLAPTRQSQRPVEGFAPIRMWRSASAP